MKKVIERAKEVFDIESEAISNLSKNIDKNFIESVNAIMNCSGKVIIIGMGKSGIIGRKIAATLASTGTQSFFIHPAEAYHGDLGMISKNDIIILISYSGETNEVLKLISYLIKNENIIISITGNPNSTLAKNTQFHLNVSVEREACPLQLVPTSSTTATLAMGDALAVVLMENKGFQSENFANFHPGGNIGKRLLTSVKDIMRKNDLPIMNKNASIKEIIHRISAGRLGISVIVENTKIIGVITDGDVRRAMEKNEESFFKLNASDFLKKKPPICVSKDIKLNEVERILTENKINSVLVSEKNTLIGIIQIYDLSI